MRLAKAFAEIDSGEREPAETRIIGYMPIGSIQGSGSISVSAQEVVVPSRDIVFHAVRFEVESGDDYPTEGIATIQLEDAMKLLVSLENLSNAQISTERFALSEVVAIVGDLKVTVFNTAQRKVLAAVDVSGTTCHLNKRADLLNLHKLVELAVQHLEANMPRLG